MTAGQLVRLREALGWKVERLADYLGVSVGAVYRWERGERRVTNRRVRELLADLYDQHLGSPWTRERARRELSKRLRVDADRAGRLLMQYRRAPGETWRDVVGRVVDGERFDESQRVRRRA